MNEVILARFMKFLLDCQLIKEGLHFQSIIDEFNKREYQLAFEYDKKMDQIAMANEMAIEEQRSRQ